MQDQASPKQPKNNKHNKSIHVFAMGGTIDKIYFDELSEYKVGQPQVNSIFSEAGLGLDIVITSICHKDSLELTDEDRQKLLDGITSSTHSHIMVTHGTDTMARTAQFIKTSVESNSIAKTIVFVGAMNPACFKKSDAPFNVGFALGALQASQPGVYLAMNGHIFNPDEVQKNRAAHQFQPIDS